MRMSTTFGQMTMLGNYAVVEAAYGLGEKFLLCTRDLPKVCTRDLPKVHGRIVMMDEYQRRLNDAYEALRPFTLAARKDLKVPGRTTRRRTEQTQ